MLSLCEKQKTLRQDDGRAKEAATPQPPGQAACCRELGGAGGAPSEELGAKESRGSLLRAPAEAPEAHRGGGLGGGGDGMIE